MTLNAETTSEHRVIDTRWDDEEDLCCDQCGAAVCWPNYRVIAGRFDEEGDSVLCLSCLEGRTR